MYTLNGFGAFGKILLPDDILQPGNEYIFTYDHGRLFEYRSDNWVLENLRERMANFGHVVTVTRPFFSSRYLVVVIPTTAVSVEKWISAFDSSFQDMGYGKAVFIIAETGKISAEPGGLRQVIPEMAQVAAKAVEPAVKAVIPQIGPYILIFGLGALAIILMSRKVRPI